MRSASSTLFPSRVQAHDIFLSGLFHAPLFSNCVRLMPASGVPKTIAYLYGGQGSMNTPGWSPDSQRIAFVSNSRL